MVINRRQSASLPAAPAFLVAPWSNSLFDMFLTSKNLERYTRIKAWDNGYLVVMAKNKSKPEHEDYIDLLPILENLYMNPAEFLSGIKNVEIHYE